MNKHAHPAFINSSHLLIFLVISGLVSRFLVLPFHIYGELIPWLVAFSYTAVLYIAWHLLNQFIEENNIFMYFIISFIIFPILAGLLLNALIGPLQEGTVPVLHGAGVFHWQALPSTAYPSVLLNYGAITFGFSLVLSLPLEWLASKIIARYASGRVFKNLLALDKKLDNSSANFTYKYFHTSERGLVVGIVTLCLYLLLSTVLFRV